MSHVLYLAFMKEADLINEELDKIKIQKTTSSAACKRRLAKLEKLKERLEKLKTINP